MVKPTDAVIGLDDLLAAGLDLNDEDAVRRAMMRLGDLEPYLAGYLDREIVQMAGKLVLAGASPPVCREMTTVVLTIVLTAFAAQRRASNRLWSEAMTGTPLAELASPVPPPPEPEPPPDEQKIPF